METQSKLKFASDYKVGCAYENAAGPGMMGGQKMYMIYSNHVLMINIDNELITKHEGDAMARLYRGGDRFKEIPVKVFKDNLRELIFQMGIYEFVKSE